MNILELNKRAWNKIGKMNVSPYLKHRRYLEMFDLFCNKLPKKAKVLDLGCGNGLPITKELVKRGFDVTAIDISDTMVKLARRNVPNAKYIRVSITDIDFDKEFDGIISSFSMLCLDPNNFKVSARKISNALTNGGYFLLALNEPGPAGHNEDESITKIMGQKMYSRPYTENEITEIFGKNGMYIVRVKRETVVSKEYGKEYTLFVLLRKKPTKH